MINKVGRDIPDELIGRHGVYMGAGYRDGETYTKCGVNVRICEKPQGSKLVGSIREAIEKCGMKDGMTVSFHHHFRDGDYVASMVMKEIKAMGIKDVTIAASSLGTAHDAIADMIEEGIVTGIQTSGIRGRLGEVVSAGKLKTPAVIRSHGGRVRAIEEGDVHIDVAFIGAPTADEFGQRPRRWRQERLRRAVLCNGGCKIRRPCCYNNRYARAESEPARKHTGNRRGLCSFAWMR